jgi:large subunit ribosomal protein L16
MLMQAAKYADDAALEGARFLRRGGNSAKSYLQAVEPGWLTARQPKPPGVLLCGMNAAQNLDPCFRISLQSSTAETRKGGCAVVEYYVAVIRPGRVIFELGGGLPEDIAREALRLAQYKLAIKTKVIARHEHVGGEA